MDADFSVELGAEDEALEFPWSDPDGRVRFVDLKNHPELLGSVPEVAQYPELGACLAALNAAGSPFVTAKCDAWLDAELSEAEEIYGAAMKFGSYVDVLFADERRFSFETNEQLVRRVCELLSRAPEIPASAELALRRCYYHDASEPVRPGFYVTSYVFGYGDDEAEARQRWGIGLSLLGDAIVQVSSERAAS